MAKSNRNRWVLGLEPFWPGVTASDTFLMDHTGAFTLSFTPGAGEGRRRMLDMVLKPAAHAAARFLELHPDAPPRARSFVSDRSTLTQVFNGLDVNGDAHVTINEALLTPPDLVLVGDADLASIYDEFRQSVSQAMKLGAGNEDVATLPGVMLSDLSADPAAFLGYGTLRRLCRLFAAHDAGIVRTLTALLTAAEKAEERGHRAAKQRAIDAFLAEVRALAGTKLTYRSASTLAALAATQ